MSEELLSAIEGTIKAPRHPNLLAIADVLRDIGRRVEGSPAEFLVPGEGLGDYLAKLAYDERPDGWDRLGAVGDLADVIPGGGALLGAAAAIPAKAGSKLSKMLAEKFPEISFSVSEAGDAIRLNKVVVPEEVRGQGLGSKFMDVLNAYADDAGKPVALTADGDFGGSKSGQQRFYSRHGFSPNKGKTKDYSFTENMIRRPRSGGRDQAGFASPEIVRLLAILGGAGYAGSKFLGDDVENSEAAQSFRPRKID